MAAVGLERRHFRILSGSILLLLLALAGVFAYQQSNWQEQQQTNSVVQGDLQNMHGKQAIAAGGLNQLDDRMASLDERLKGLDQKVTGIDQQVSGIDQQVSGLDQQLSEQQAQTEQALGEVDSRLVTQTDKLDSLRGSVANQRPRATFGKDGVIHGPQWLAGQPADNYLVYLASVSDKQKLYRLAERYAHYLKDELAYLPTKSGFALVYGSYTSEKKAKRAKSGLPPMIDGRRPKVYAMAEAQASLSR